MSDPQALIQQLETYQTRAAAMAEFRKLREQALPYLVSALEHHAEGVRWSAIKLLSELSAPEALEALKRYLSDKQIAYQVEEAISAIEARMKSAPTPPKAQPAPPTQVRAAPPDVEDLIKQVLEGADWSVSRLSDGYSIRVPLKEGRSQSVRCIFQPPKEKGSALVLVYSECGPAVPSLYEAVLMLNLRLPFGAVAIREIGGQKIFVMVNSFLRDTVTAQDLQKSIARIAREADSLEKQLTSGSDTR